MMTGVGLHREAGSRQLVGKQYAAEAEQMGSVLPPVREKAFQDGMHECGLRTHGVLAAEVKEVVELVELSRDHEEEESYQKNDRQPGLCVRRANIAIPNRAAQGSDKSKGAEMNFVDDGKFVHPRRLWRTVSELVTKLSCQGVSG